VEAPVPRAELGAIGSPLGVPPGPPGVTGGIALVLVAGNAELTWLKAGAAEVQPCGTESMPSEAARPTPALTALFIPGAAKPPVPELKPLPNAYPSAWNWLSAMLAVWPTDCMNELVMPVVEMPIVDIEPTELVPDARLVAAVEEIVNDVEDEDVIDEVAVASPGSTLDIAVVSGVDITELSGVDITELSGVDTIELSGVDTTELSGVDTTELSGVDTADTV
jgi:hypothetical protein